MEDTETNTPALPRDLGDGLVLRSATAGDAERLADFNGRIHSDQGPEHPHDGVAAWARDLMTREHPTLVPGDFTLVEDIRTGAVVSSLNLIPQTWTYAGIPFKVGRPELVGTLPDYRRRGLIRAQFEVIHAWSAERGHKVQGITGIPYYYRQFGYEMCLALGGGRAGHLAHVPPLKEGEAEPYRVRAATEADIPLLACLYAQASGRSLVSCLRDEAQWRYILGGQSDANMYRVAVCVVETAEGRPVGMLAHLARLRGSSLIVIAYEIEPGTSWAAVTPGVLRYLAAAGKASANRYPGRTFGEFVFDLVPAHPVFRAAPGWLPRTHKPYAWYVRVPDLPGFLMHIAPELDRRLAESPVAGHTGELKVSFYGRGVRLVWEQGRLTQAEEWDPRGGGAEAAFPGLTFLHLVFGHRSLDDLRYAFADCGAYGEAAPVLLEALFPPRPSTVWPVA